MISYKAHRVDAPSGTSALFTLLKLSSRLKLAAKNQEKIVECDEILALLLDQLEEKKVNEVLSYEIGGATPLEFAAQLRDAGSVKIMLDRDLSYRLLPGLLASEEKEVRNHVRNKIAEYDVDISDLKIMEKARDMVDQVCQLSPRSNICHSLMNWQLTVQHIDDEETDEDFQNLYRQLAALSREEIEELRRLGPVGERAFSELQGIVITHFMISNLAAEDVFKLEQHQIAASDRTKILELAKTGLKQTRRALVTAEALIPPYTIVMTIADLITEKAYKHSVKKDRRTAVKKWAKPAELMGKNFANQIAASKHIVMSYLEQLHKNGSMPHQVNDLKKMKKNFKIGFR
ncbi:MAG: hypothetical protein AB8C84_11270, partial [Oligoflexales bacterium]